MTMRIEIPETEPQSGNDLLEVSGALTHHVASIAAHLSCLISFAKSIEALSVIAADLNVPGTAPNPIIQRFLQSLDCLTQTVYNQRGFVTEYVGLVSCLADRIVDAGGPISPRETPVYSTETR